MYRVHVNSNRVRSNAKNGTSDPVITVRDQRNRILQYCHEVELGPSRVVYRPDDPLPCGAKVWIEAEQVFLSGSDM